MKKKIVAAFCLAMVMTVGGCSGAGTAAQPESSESQTQQMHRAAGIFLRWIRT